MGSYSEPVGAALPGSFLVFDQALFKKLSQFSFHRVRPATADRKPFAALRLPRPNPTTADPSSCLLHARARGDWRLACMLFYEPSRPARGSAGPSDLAPGSVVSLSPISLLAAPCLSSFLCRLRLVFIEEEAEVHCREQLALPLEPLPCITNIHCSRPPRASFACVSVSIGICK